MPKNRRVVSLQKMRSGGFNKVTMVDDATNGTLDDISNEVDRNKEQP